MQVSDRRVSNLYNLFIFLSPIGNGLFTRLTDIITCLCYSVRIIMLDGVFVGLVIFLFAVMFVYATACDRL
jgi:hypothetical protein